MEPLVSVIVPVYNVKDYIARCVNSIRGQTYQNLEIILVDDGSRDGSAELCRQLAAQDSRIRLILKENEGSGYARNSGMDIARGDWFLFVDSDDYLLPDCIRRCLEVARREGCDMVKFPFQRGNRESCRRQPRKKPYKIYDRYQAFRTREVDICVCGKLCARHVVGDRRYPRVTKYDDEFFTYRLTYAASRIALLDEPYYYYYMSPNSIMRGKMPVQPLEDIRAYEERIAFFEERQERELADISRKELAIHVMLAYLNRHRYASSPMTEEELLSRFRRAYAQGRSHARGIKEKLCLGVFAACPRGAALGCRLILK